MSHARVSIPIPTTCTYLLLIDDHYPFLVNFKMDIAILVSFFMSVAAYAAANSLIHSKTIKDSFIKANLFGKDLNKKSEAKV